MKPAPLVSIGLSVTGAGAAIGESVASALTQTFTNFELIILDETPGDTAQATLETDVATDARLRYFRAGDGLPQQLDSKHSQRRKTDEALRRAVASARGRYFKWLQAGDVMQPDCIERLVVALHLHSEAVLAFGSRAGPSAAVLPSRHLEMSWTAKPVSRRYRAFLDCLTLHGETALEAGILSTALVRTESLRSTRFIKTGKGSMTQLLAELVLRGEFVQVPRSLYASSQEMPAAKQDRLFRAQRRSLACLPVALQAELSLLRKAGLLSSHLVRLFRTSPSMSADEGALISNPGL